jgi:hypothetical protein
MTSFPVSHFQLRMIKVVVLDSVKASVCAIGHKVRGFNPG